MLEKQKIIQKLEKQLQELITISMHEHIDVQEEIKSLRNKIETYKNEMWNNLEPWDRVQLARSVTRPTALDYIEQIFEHFTELHGDRLYGEDASIVGGIASLNGIPVTIIAQQKGRNMKENIKRNFSMPNPEGYRKSLRLMKQAEKFHRPILCFVDTPGAYPGLGAEERGQGEAIAKNLFYMSDLKVPTLSIIIGEGGSGGALALAVTNEVWMLENSIYSILSPEGFASILWKDSKRAKEASKVMKITANDLMQLGIIDKVIKEPVYGIHENQGDLVQYMKKEIEDFITRMSKLTEEELQNHRYEKFRTCY